jgi:hypothetical protein
LAGGRERLDCPPTWKSPKTAKHLNACNAYINTNELKESKAMNHEPEANLAAVIGALQALGDAVSANDRSAYLAAFQLAAAAGVGDEQIRDAHAWRNAVRGRIGHRRASFDWRGTPRP